MYNKNSKKLSVSTFSIKVFFLIVLFFGFPYVLITVLGKYQTKASGIVEQDNAIIEIYSEKNNQIKVLSRSEADTLSQIHKFISGTWISEFDGRYKLIVDENNKFEEYYDDAKEGFGVWRVFSGIRDTVNLASDPGFSSDSVQEKDSVSVDIDPKGESIASIPSAYTKDQFENKKPEDPKYFFQKQQFEPSHKGEIYIYQIQQLDTEKFVLVFKNGAGVPLIFIKATSTASTY